MGQRGDYMWSICLDRTVWPIKLMTMRCTSARFVRFAVSLGLLGFVWTCLGAEARLDVLEVPGRTLRNNPLRDPVVRNAAVFLPAQFETNRTMPVVYFLPGFGGSSEKCISQKQIWLKFVQDTADAGLAIILVVVDGRTRWGGSQYINSPAQGDYADYVCREIVPFVERHYHLRVSQGRRVIAGHSSGGYGALRLGSMHPRLFGKVVALSPDSDFEVSHRPLVMVSSVSRIPAADVKKLAGPTPSLPTPSNGDVRYALALSAAYAPRGTRYPGEFEWLYDNAGRFREAVWAQWIQNDPLTLVQNNRRAFRADQSVYLDGPTEDEYKANIGARRIYETLHQRRGRCMFEEPPGKHSSRAQERLRRGLMWCFQKL